MWVCVGVGVGVGVGVVVGVVVCVRSTSLLDIHTDI